MEDRKLLYIDLCARLPYGVRYKGDCGWPINPYQHTTSLCNILNAKEPLVYLRPMSSMTEEEREDAREKFFDESDHYDIDDIGEIYADTYQPYTSVYTLSFARLSGYIDWLNAHHFDYRGLIEKGLALEAPDGMYNKEESEKRSEIPIPKTVDEAVKTLAKIVSKEDRDYLLKNGAISMHDSLGRWIRNEWGLWTGSDLKDELMNMNKGLNHPDDMSNYIIEEFVKYWNNKI